ncbi:hypothetical protein BKA60DRAFT_563203 [Fusarium oxysporum]|nr:hypothetical protein BKA60DRAFT_563203 [Fusarium oxysporum]
MDKGVLDHTPEMIHNIAQPDFEEYLGERLSNEYRVDIQKGMTFVSLAQSKVTVTTVVEERATGQLNYSRSDQSIL